MRTTIAGIVGLVLLFVLARAVTAGGASLGTFGALLFTALGLAALGAVLVGPFLWVRESKAHKAEELALLRRIAEQNKTD